MNEREQGEKKWKKEQLVQILHKFKLIQYRLFESDFDKAIKQFENSDWI